MKKLQNQKNKNLLKTNNIKKKIITQSSDLKINDAPKSLFELQQELKNYLQQELKIDKELSKLIQQREKLQLKKNLTIDEKKLVELSLIWESELEVEKKLIEIRKEATQEFIQVEEEKKNDKKLKNKMETMYKDVDPKIILKEALEKELLKESEEQANLQRNVRNLMEKQGFPELVISTKLNIFQDISRARIKQLKDTCLQKIQEVDTNKELRESIFKEYFIEKKNRFFDLEKEVTFPAMTELRYREIQKQKLEEDKLYKEKQKEQEKWKLFKNELRHLFTTSISFSAAMNYLELFFGKNLNERLFSVIRERDISFLNIPLNEKRVFKINFSYKEREALFFHIYSILKAYLEGEKSIKILANSLYLSLLHLLFIKDFISQCVYYDDETFEISFTRSRDPFINNKFIYYSVLWVSEIDNPFYCSYEDLKKLFENKQYFFTFGLVLTEKGFRSVLDCVNNKMGGELILLIKIESVKNS